MNDCDNLNCVAYWMSSLCPTYLCSTNGRHEREFQNISECSIPDVFGRRIEDVVF